MDQAKENELLICKELLHCYEVALKNYCEKKSRVGCNKTYLTTFRHSFKEYPKLVSLRQSLEKEQNIMSALILVIHHFRDKGTAFRDYSFNSYFIDALNESNYFKETNWEDIVYRGDMRRPTVIFDSGFTEITPSNNDSDYIKGYTGTTGISTSKDLRVAENYAKSSENFLSRILCCCRGLRFTPRSKAGCVYAISREGLEGFDVVAASRAHVLSFWDPDYLNALENQEVNIKDRIPRDNILGVFDLSRKQSVLFRKNPNYKGKPPKLTPVFK